MGNQTSRPSNGEYRNSFLRSPGIYPHLYSGPVGAKVVQLRLALFLLGNGFGSLTVAEILQSLLLTGTVQMAHSQRENRRSCIVAVQVALLSDSHTCVGKSKSRATCFRGLEAVFRSKVVCI